MTATGTGRSWLPAAHLRAKLDDAAGIWPSDPGRMVACFSTSNEVEKSAIHLGDLDVDSTAPAAACTTLAAAVRMGQDARSSCTLNDPPSETGIHGWGRTVRGLRENTIPLGWSRFDDGRIHGVINADGTLVIAVAASDAATGRVGPDPKTAYPKGERMQNAVKRNAAQLCLSIDLDIVPIRKVDPTPKCLLWVLVVCEDEVEVRFELSLPDSVGADERVDAWVERIILAPIPIDSTPRERLEADSEPDIDIPLTRKG